MNWTFISWRFFASANTPFYVSTEGSLPFYVGLYYFLSQVKNNTTLSWLSLTSVLVYVAAFSVGLGPVPWLVAGEIVPLKTRSLTSSIGVICVWLSNFLITKEIFDLEAEITDYGTYWLCAGINFGCFLFVLFLLPETKGKTLEEIEKYFDKEKTDISSYDSLKNDWADDIKNQRHSTAGFNA